MSLLPWGSPPPSRTNVYSPADYVVAPRGSGHKADFYTDGVSDQVEINAAITAAAALAHGGTVEVITGVYQISGRIIPLSNVWLRGWGMFSTIFQATSALTAGILDNKAEYDTTNPYVNGTISDIQLDGTNMDRTRELKGFNSDSLNNCKIMRVYAHDTTATGIGPDDFYGSTVTECIVTNCGYMNTKIITAASWSANTIVFTASAAHGYSVNDVIIVTGMVPTPYNGRYTITTVTSTTFTVTSTFLDINPGTATIFGISSDSLIGHNGIGIASGANTHEANIITNNFCIGNQNNNYLIEADTTFTDNNASYIFDGNYSSGAGQCGFLNTGTPNVQLSNFYDFGSNIGAQIACTTQAKSISAASWSGGIISVTLSSAFTTNIYVGDPIEITGMTPSAYNGYYKLASVTSNSQFTVALANDPGTATVFGSTTRVPHNTDDTTINNVILSDNVIYGLRITPRSGRYKLNEVTTKRCYNYGMSLGAGNGTATNISSYLNGRDGIDIETGSGTYWPIAHLSISDYQVYNNGTRATYDGIEIQSASTAPISDLTFSDGHAYDDQATKTQRYGMIIRSGGILSNISVNDSDLTGNATGPILVQNTSNTISVVNTQGVNPQAKVDLGNITGATTFDSTTGNIFIATLTGNIAPSIPAGAVKGMVITMIWTQDATGGRTATTPSNVKPANGSIVLSSAAGAVDSFSYVWDGSNWRESSPAIGRLSSLGTSGQVLTSNGTSALPTFQAVSKALTYVSTAVNYPLTTADVVEITASGKIITLPDATTAVIKPYTVKNTSAGNCSFATTSSQTVDGSTTGTIIPNQSLVVIPNGTNWIIV